MGDRADHRGISAEPRFIRLGIRDRGVGTIILADRGILPAARTEREGHRALFEELPEGIIRGFAADHLLRFVLPVLFGDGKLGVDPVCVYGEPHRVYAGRIWTVAINQRGIDHRFSVPDLAANCPAGGTQGAGYREYFIFSGVFIDELGEIIYSRVRRSHGPGNRGDAVRADDIFRHRENVQTGGYREKHGSAGIMRIHRQFQRAVDGGIFPGQVSDEAVPGMGAGFVAGVFCRGRVFVVEGI